MKHIIAQGSFLVELSDFAHLLLPVVGVIVLILLGWVLWEVINVVKNLDTTVSKVNDTIDIVDSSLNRLEAPLKTVENISQSVDDVMNFVRHSVIEKSVDMISENFTVVKDWASSLFKKKSKDSEPVVDVNLDQDENTEINIEL